MAAKDKFHGAVRRALEKDGWLVTDDPYILKIGGRRQKIDLGAEKIISAQRDGEKIAVEVKSFLGDSPLNDFYEALGQFLAYNTGLELQEPDRYLYLAISHRTHQVFEKYELMRLLIVKHEVRLIVFDPFVEKIELWQT